MSMSKPIVSYNLVRRLHNRPSPKFQAFLFNAYICRWEIPKPMGGLGFLRSQSLQHLNTIHRSPNHRNAKRNFSVYSSLPSGVPLPSGPPPCSWKGWLLGIIVTVILPFVTHKWGPLLKWTNEFEAVVDKFEDIVDAVEEVAENLDKVAEGISDKLPEGKLRRAVDFVEDMAEEIDKGAELLGDIIDKVQEMEEKAESFMEEDSEVAQKAKMKKQVQIMEEKVESFMEEESEVAKKASDNKTSKL